jgi:hypothetical protein
MRPRTLFGSGGKPDIQDLNGPEAIRLFNRQIGSLVRPQNESHIFVAANYP